MAAGQKVIQIEGTNLTISTDNWIFQEFALELARATRRHMEEVNAGIVEEKKRKRREARKRKQGEIKNR